jgi:hypothetical protein
VTYWAPPTLPPPWSFRRIAKQKLNELNNELKRANSETQKQLEEVTAELDRRRDAHRKLEGAFEALKADAYCWHIKLRKVGSAGCVGSRWGTSLAVLCAPVKRAQRAVEGRHAHTGHPTCVGWCVVCRPGRTQTYLQIRWSSLTRSVAEWRALVGGSHTIAGGSPVWAGRRKTRNALAGRKFAAAEDRGAEYAGVYV